MKSSLLASTWGKPVFMATIQRVSSGPNLGWLLWSRGRSLSCSSWMCLSGTGDSTCAECRSLKSTRTAGRLHPTALLLLSLEVSIEAMGQIFWSGRKCNEQLTFYLYLQLLYLWWHLIVAGNSNHLKSVTHSVIFLESVNKLYLVVHGLINIHTYTWTWTK